MQVRLSIFGRDFTITLISRRSRHFAGTRYSFAWMCHIYIVILWMSVKFSSPPFCWIHLPRQLFGDRVLHLHPPTSPPTLLQRPSDIFFSHGSASRLLDTMEVICCKVLHSLDGEWTTPFRKHWSLNHLGQFRESVEMVFWCLSRAYQRSRGRFFQRFEELDRERLKLSKFRADTCWILCCDLWLASGVWSTIMVSSGEAKKGWSMLESFFSNLEYKNWFLSHTPTS